MMGYDSGLFGVMHGWGWIFWLLLIAFAVFALWSGTAARGDRPRESPRELLQRRLARGEITPQEYEERKALLDRDGAS